MNIFVSAILGFIALSALAVVLYVLMQARKTAKLAAQAEMAAPPQGQFVTISTGKLHYTDEGEGRPIVLVHGLGGQLRTMTLLLTKALMGRFRVIAIDRPGMGYSERAESASARIDDQAGYVEEVIDALGLHDPIVMGHSLGGAIAAATALRAPSKIAALALVAPLLAPSTLSSSAFAALGITKPGMRRFIANTMAVPATMKNQEVTRTQIFGPDSVPANYSVDGGGILSLRPKSFLNTSRDFCAVPEVMPAQSERYNEITCPVRVIYGTEDRILDHKEQGIELAKRYPHFRLQLVEGAGHMLVTAHVDAVVGMIEALEDELTNAPNLAAFSA